MALIDITGMLVTQIIIMRHTLRTKLNMVEFISLRICFSIYTGWVAAATIIGVCFVLRTAGLSDPNAGFSESVWTAIVLYLGLPIYWIASYHERNPLFGLVYLWVVVAIRDINI